jgi:hypothetical protein
LQLVIDTDTDKLETVVATLSVAYGRDVSVAARGRTARRTASASASAGRGRRRRQSGPTSAQVREWAASSGIAVSPRGRISTEVWDKYRAAN